MINNTKASGENTSRCSGSAADQNRWQCRILDGKSYTITTETNQVLSEENTPKNSSRSGSRAASVGQVYKYGDSAVKDFLQLEDGLYAVQIFANSNKEAGVAFINAKRLGRARLLHTEVNGRNWYVALLGVYPDLKLARKRAKAYQEVHGGAALWIRSVKSLKAVYKETVI